MDIVIVTETIVPANTNDGADLPAEAHPPSPRGEAEQRALLVARIGEAVRVVTSHQRCATASRLHHAGISMAHLHVLWILGEHGSLPISRLADLVGEQRGLVTRERVADDRRVVLVRVTDAGREVTDTVDGWRAGMLQRLFGRFEVRELERVLAALDDERAAFASGAPGSVTSSRTPCPDESKETPSR
jgi:DNA-binding MarR family transcriptional regulator